MSPSRQAASWQDSWAKALALYDSLTGPEWGHIRPFRELVQLLSGSDAARGLSAVTSHETLRISPYTRYPDVVDGRHVRVQPLPDGTIRVERVPAGGDLQKTDSWTLPLEQSREKILELMAEL